MESKPTIIFLSSMTQQFKTKMSIKEIKINSNQIWITIENNDHVYNECFRLYEISRLLLMSFDTEITIKSRTYPYRNGTPKKLENFRNWFYFSLYRLLDNQHLSNWKETINHNYWLLSEIKEIDVSDSGYKSKQIIAKIKNLYGQSVDDYATA